MKSRFLYSLTLVLIAVAAHAQSAPAPPPQPDPVLGSRITEGVVLGDRLWLRGTMISNDDPLGGLVSLGLREPLRQVHFNRGVFAIRKIGRDLWVLRQPLPKERNLVLSVWENNTFRDAAKFVAAAKDDPIALLGDSGLPAVLSQRSLRVLSANHKSWHRLPLHGKLRSGVQVTVASPMDGSNTLYVGLNVGEWGGGLQRVDLKTGVVTNIERRDNQGLCAGPLNSDCDPVTGVIPDPQNKDCVLAAVGLVHLGTSHGRILRVCGENVTLVWRKFAPRAPNIKESVVEAVYGLAPDSDNGFWAITWRALYRFSADGTNQKEYALPELKPVSGVYLSRELPGVIVVRTDVNWAVSTSGYTPLVIPLQVALKTDK